jgi:hypothetical protein
MQLGQTQKKEKVNRKEEDKGLDIKNTDAKKKEEFSFFSFIFKH